jgi:hypothetical protein
MLSWLIGCVLIAWLVAYNLMRIGGDNPSQAALPALGIGVVVGVAVFAAGLLVLRRIHASGRRLRNPAVEIPSPSAMEPAQRDAVRLAWAPLGLLAAVAIAMGAYLAVEWFGESSRSIGTVLLAGWNLLVGLWLGDEAIRLRRLEAEGIESIVLGCTLTAVLAGVGLSRDLAEPGQIVLIALAGVAGAMVGLAVWRFHGARGLPAGSIGVLAVAVLALVLPLTL